MAADLAARWSKVGGVFGTEPDQPGRLGTYFSGLLSTSIQIAAQSELGRLIA